MEAGTYSKPCLAFKHSGGPEELLSKNRGIIVSYADYNTTADEINKLIDDEKLYNKYASSINKFVIKNNSQNSFLYYKKSLIALLYEFGTIPILINLDKLNPQRLFIKNTD